MPDMKPQTKLFTFVVRIEAATEEQASTVMRERLGHDEDYGFDYQIHDWSRHD